MNWTDWTDWATLYSARWHLSLLNPARRQLNKQLEKNKVLFDEQDDEVVQRVLRK